VAQVRSLDTNPTPEELRHFATQIRRCATRLRRGLMLRFVQAARMSIRRVEQKTIPAVTLLQFAAIRRRNRHFGYRHQMSDVKIE